MLEKDKHWIIVNNRKGCIWKQPYLTHEEAQEEFAFQIRMLGLGRTHNYEIEEHVTLFRK
jgi:hypothetical protein